MLVALSLTAALLEACSTENCQAVGATNGVAISYDQKLASADPAELRVCVVGGPCVDQKVDTLLAPSQVNFDAIDSKDPVNLDVVVTKDGKQIGGGHASVTPTLFDFNKSCGPSSWIAHVRVTPDGLEAEPG